MSKIEAMPHLDAAMKSAQESCEAFLVAFPKMKTRKAVAGELDKVFKALMRVLVGIDLTLSTAMKGRGAIQVFSTSASAGPVKESVRILFQDSGRFYRENTLTMGDDEAVVAHKVVPIELDELLSLGVTGRDLAISVQKFLADPQTGFLHLSHSTKN